MKPPLFVSLCLGLLTPALRAADQPVPVQQEPNHQKVFENAEYRIIDVHLPVGSVTQYHIHAVPSAIVYLTKSTNRSQTWGETATTPRETTPGDSRYAAYDEKPLTHQVTNPGPTPFRVFDIELLKPAGMKPYAALSQPNVKLQWEEKRLRSYSVTLAPGSVSNFPAASGGRLLIGIAGDATAREGKGAARKLSNGDYSYYAASNSFQVRNEGREKAELVLLELK